MPVEYRAELGMDVPDEIEVFELQRPLDDPFGALERLRRMAPDFGLSGDRIDASLSEDWTTYLEPPYELSVHGRSGALFYRHRERYMTASDTPFELSDEECHRIAVDFLERTRIASMNDARLLKVTHLRAAAGNKDGRERREPTVMDAGVVFRRLVEGLPTVGPGGLVMVNIDGRGEVVGMRSVWRDIAGSAGRVKLRRPEEAMRRLEELADGLRGTVILTKAEFGYYERGESESQKFLQPAYFLLYAIQDEEVTAKKIEVVPAGSEVMEPLLGEKVFAVKKQPVREKRRAD